jgi:DNA-directed RNA polymerase sigma subunit (sigma70/sigma32)
VISQVLTSCGITEQDFTCTPEYKSSLGKGFGRGGCRNHDLLMEGDEDCIIGVEAKVSESFDKDWINALNIQKKKTNEEDTRAYRLRKRLVKFDSQEVDKIGYQLFTATRATINYAIEKKKNKCIVLVIVFEGEIDKGNKYEEKVAKNNKDFVEFCKAVGVQDGKIKIDGIECWIKKVTINISKSYKLNEQDVNTEYYYSLEEELETIQSIQQGGKESEIAIEKLKQRLVTAIAKRYVNTNLSMAELIQAGNKGLVLAAKNFDESRGFKFICYVVWWVRASIEMEIEKSNANKKISPKGKS